MLFSEFNVHVEGINVKGEIRGERIDPKRHRRLVDFISGAAFTELSAEEADLKAGTPARVCVVLNDSARHPLPLLRLWGDE